MDLNISLSDKRKGGICRNVCIPKSLLLHLYLDEKHTTLEIAKILNCSQDTICRRLKSYDIPRRDRKVPINNQELIKLYTEEKLSIKKIAMRFGCSHTTISNRLRELGVKRAVLAPARLCINDSTIIKAYKSGNSATFIARELGVSRWVILEKLRAHGIPIRQSFKKKYINNREIQHLYMIQNFSTTELGEIYGVKPCTVAARLREAGIKLRGNRKYINTRDLLYMYEDENKSVAEIAKIYKCSYAVIKHRLDKLGVYKRRNILQLDSEKIISLYVNEGYTLAELAAQYNCCENSILNILKKNNIERRKRGQRRE